ncbi:MAG: type III-B CRISPR module RAMP protein Cmr1 [Stygiobacter sp.]
MEKITFQCETITPMFLAGADGKTPELRPPSIKAAMRFWWRAMHGDLSLSDLKKDEAKIFGGSGENEGRSKFSIRIKHDLKISNQNISGNYIAKNPDWYKYSVSLNKPIKVNPIEYLGYGPYNFKDKWQKYIPANSKFEITIIVHNTDFKEEIVDSFRYLASFGALGSKSRNGFGKIKILNEEYLSLEKLKSSTKASTYSHISSDIRIFKLQNNFDTWERTIAKLGEIYRYAKVEADGEKHKYDKRKFIAAPVKKDVFVRKTKPYFFNIWKYGNKQYSGFILYMPYFELISDKEIYTRGFNTDFPTELKNACDTLNYKILSFDREIEEVIL